MASLQHKPQQILAFSFSLNILQCLTLLQFDFTSVAAVYVAERQLFFDSFLKLKIRRL